jgi:hypothetical protein
VTLPPLDGHTAITVVQILENVIDVCEPFVPLGPSIGSGG